MSVEELYANATRKQLNMSAYLQNPPLKQHQVLGLSSTVKKVNGRWLTLVNAGHCPSHCNVSVKVTDESHDNETVWNFQHDNTYGMVPAILVFNTHTGASPLVEPVSGFVLKFWTWMSANSHLSSSKIRDNNTMSAVSSNPLFRYRLKRFVRYRKWAEMHTEKERFRRSVITPLKQNARNGSSVRVDLHQLKERVVLYTFNATDNHIVNASLNDVTQFCCSQGPSEKDQLCQPDLSFQEQSRMCNSLCGYNFSSNLHHECHHILWYI
jgi:hypothetical protein